MLSDIQEAQASRAALNSAWRDYGSQVQPGHASPFREHDSLAPSSILLPTPSPAAMVQCPDAVPCHWQHTSRLCTGVFSLPLLPPRPTAAMHHHHRYYPSPPPTHLARLFFAHLVLS